MKPILQRILMAYRPLYLRGLLLDGQYRLPVAGGSATPEKAPRRKRQRQPPIAWAHMTFQPRSKP